MLINHSLLLLTCIGLIYNKNFLAMCKGWICFASPHAHFACSSVQTLLGKCKHWPDISILSQPAHAFPIMHDQRQGKRHKYIYSHSLSDLFFNFCFSTHSLKCSNYFQSELPRNLQLDPTFHRWSPLYPVPRKAPHIGGSIGDWCLGRAPPSGSNYFLFQAVLSKQLTK